MEAADKGEWWYKPEYAFNAVNINSAMANPQHNSIVYATEDHEVQTVPVNGYVLQTFSPIKGIVSDQSVGAVCCLVDVGKQLCSSIHKEYTRNATVVSGRAQLFTFDPPSNR